MTAKLVEGDLLDHDAQYIAHQCNCTSKGAANLAKAVFSKYPYANIYNERNRKEPFWHKPGELYIRGGIGEGRFIINMTAQVLPGGPGKTLEVAPGMSIVETTETREKLFVECLKKIKTIETLRSIAFPWRIGCGVAEGDWNRYRMVIDRFAALLQKGGIDVFIVKRPEDE
jgi:O-acetyl-ADP-ribose deacetylase (regulator of RNase III)